MILVKYKGPEHLYVIVHEMTAGVTKQGTASINRINVLFITKATLPYPILSVHSFLALMIQHVEIYTLLQYWLFFVPSVT